MFTTTKSVYKVINISLDKSYSSHQNTEFRRFTKNEVCHSVSSFLPPPSVPLHLSEQPVRGRRGSHSAVSSNRLQSQPKNGTERQLLFELVSNN